MKLNYLPVGKAFENVSDHSLLLQIVKIEKGLHISGLLYVWTLNSVTVL